MMRLRSKVVKKYQGWGWALPSTNSENGLCHYCEGGREKGRRKKESKFYLWEAKQERFEDGRGILSEADCLCKQNTLLSEWGFRDKNLTPKFFPCAANSTAEWNKWKAFTFHQLSLALAFDGAVSSGIRAKHRLPGLEESICSLLLACRFRLQAHLARPSRSSSVPFYMERHLVTTVMRGRRLLP